ncbi:MAG TPA: VOC family protein [Conexibacter sp.]|jgi:catechol 2,3-dioxygenase-like lactoylglutathione lyase family enzyme
MTTPETPNWDWSRPIFDHVHLRVSDLAASRAFYATVLQPLGIPLLLDAPHLVAFANLALSADGEPSERVHLAFTAADREMVEAFHAAGIDAGYRDNGASGVRDHGPPGSTYYAAYLLDPDGNNVEAVYRAFAG